MASNTTKKRVSKDDWLKAALELLASSGVEGIKIDVLSLQLGVAKTGFYWHFKNRQELLTEILNYWEAEYTDTVSNNPLLQAMAPQERLQALSEAVIDFNLTKYDLAIAQWAQLDPEAKLLLQHSYKVRLSYVRKAFREIGFKGDELEMRTQLFVCYTSNEQDMFGASNTARDRRMRKLRVQLLCSPVK